MYLLYVNDIMDSNMISDLNMFADDTAIVAHGSVLTDVVAQITGDIKKLGDWLNYNKLTVNLDKTKCMYFGKGLYENHMPLMPLIEMFYIIQWIYTLKPNYSHVNIID